MIFLEINLVTPAAFRWWWTIPTCFHKHYLSATSINWQNDNFVWRVSRICKWQTLFHAQTSKTLGAIRIFNVLFKYLNSIRVLFSVDVSLPCWVSRRRSTCTAWDLWRSSSIRILILTYLTWQILLAWLWDSPGTFTEKMQTR